MGPGPLDRVATHSGKQGHEFICVKDISVTTLPRNLKFCTHDKYD